MKNRKKAVAAIVAAVLLLVVLLFPIRMNLKDGCLLYTSDAADEL